MVKYWRIIIYLMICCALTQYYLGIIVMACDSISLGIKGDDVEIIEIPTITLKSEGRNNAMGKIEIVDAKPYIRPEYQWNDWMDVRKPSGITAEELHEVMYYDENDYAPYYVEAERRYGINAIFLYAIAQNESQNGRSAIAKNKNNLFGWTGNDGHMRFNSVEECIYYVAEALQNNYLNPDGRYFSGYSLRDVSRHYNDNDYWRNLTLEIADVMQNRIISSRNKQSV